MVRETATIDGVTDATLFEAVIIPPLKQVPRFDVLSLIRATAPEVLDQVRNSTVRWWNYGDRCGGVSIPNPHCHARGVVTCPR
jgi:hypothetical protein